MLRRNEGENMLASAFPVFISHPTCISPSPNITTRFSIFFFFSLEKNGRYLRRIIPDLYLLVWGYIKSEATWQPHFRSAFFPHEAGVRVSPSPPPSPLPVKLLFYTPLPQPGRSVVSFTPLENVWMLITHLKYPFWKIYVARGGKGSLVLIRGKAKAIWYFHTFRSGF